GRDAARPPARRSGGAAARAPRRRARAGRARSRGGRAGGRGDGRRADPRLVAGGGPAPPGEDRPRQPRRLPGQGHRARERARPLPRHLRRPHRARRPVRRAGGAWSLAGGAAGVRRAHRPALVRLQRRAPAPGGARGGGPAPWSAAGVGVGARRAHGRPRPLPRRAGAAGRGREGAGAAPPRARHGPSGERGDAGGGQGVVGPRLDGGAGEPRALDAVRAARRLPGAAGALRLRLARPRPGRLPRGRAAVAPGGVPAALLPGGRRGGRVSAVGEAGARPAALVTGSAKGVGRAVLLALAEDGFDVAVHYRRSRGEAEEVAEAARALGARAVVLQADVTVETEARELVDEAVAAFGRLDVLVNNVG